MTKQTLQKISVIHKKIELLKQQQTKLTAKLELKIIALLKNAEAFENDFEILYGAIYELTQKLNHAHLHNSNSDHPSSIEMANWRLLGAKRLGENRDKAVATKVKTDKIIKEKTTDADSKSKSNPN